MVLQSSMMFVMWVYLCPLSSRFSFYCELVFAGATKPELSLNPQFALKVLSEGEEAGEVPRASNSLGSRSNRRLSNAASKSPFSNTNGRSRSNDEASDVFLIEITLVFPGSGKPKPSVFLAAGTAEERNAWVKAINGNKRNVPRGPRTAT